MTYSETPYAHGHFHSAPLYALRTERYSYIQAPRREVYDLSSDPEESHNIASRNSAVIHNLQEQLDKALSWARWDAQRPVVNPEVLEALRGLGYVNMASPAAGHVASSLPDPKDRIGLYREFQDALDLEKESKARSLSRAVSKLERIVACDPALVSVQIESGLARQRLGQDTLAIARFRAALRGGPQTH